MTCAICRHGTLEDGSATVTLERGDSTLIFKHVPARICDNCGEEYLSAETNEALLHRAEEELKKGVTLELVEFAA